MVQFGTACVAAMVLVNMSQSSFDWAYYMERMCTCVHIPIAMCACVLYDLCGATDIGGIGSPDVCCIDILYCVVLVQAISLVLLVGDLCGPGAMYSAVDGLCVCVF